MLSVLIVSWNTRELLQSCLKSIYLYPPSGEFEVIVVDNDSTDQSAEMVSANFPLVQLIHETKNRGYAQGNNRAFSFATGNWLVTLNPDTEVNSGCFDNAIQALSDLTHYGALGIRQMGVDGKIQRSVRGFPTLRGIIGDALGLAGARPNSGWDSYRLTGFDYTLAQPAPQPMGTFLLFRRSALEAVGDSKNPFDNLFPIFFNEVDLLFRLYEAGWPCWYTPEVSILHHGGESTKQVRKSMIWESHRSLVRYLRKHYGTTANALGLGILSALILSAAFVRARGYHAGFRT